MAKRIYLCLAHMSGEEMKFIQEAFDTNWVVPLGPNVNGLETSPSTPVPPTTLNIIDPMTFANVLLHCRVVLLLFISD